MTKEQLIVFLKNNHLTPNFTYGQNFLIDEIVLQDIVDAAEVTKEDAVLEIGPGIGNMTRLLCARAGYVLSIEKDPRFIPILKSIKKDFRENFRYEVADALEYDFQKVFLQRAEEIGVSTAAQPAPYKVVANIPYYITGKILQMLLTAQHKPSSITLLMQKEVAQNAAAPLGKMSVLAVSVQLFGEPKIIQIVKARSFHPMPKVDSAVLQVMVHDKPRYVVADEKKFFSTVKACFTGKRKQLHNTLANYLKISKDEAAKILESIVIDPAVRPQELSIPDWIRLVNKISER